MPKLRPPVTVSKSTGPVSFAKAAILASRTSVDVKVPKRCVLQTIPEHFIASRAAIL